MEKQVADQIIAEIKKIEREIATQKKIIKASIGNTLAIETAEQALKALHTRKDVLSANLEKLGTQHDLGLSAESLGGVRDAAAHAAITRFVGS